MTSDTSNASFTFDFANYEAERQTFTARAGELTATNKSALFAVLTKAGITTVTVQFDGYGDSGQVEEIAAHRGDDAAELPDTTIEIVSAVWGGDEVRGQNCSVTEAIETMAYDFLGQTHGGWENNDGAYGEFTFNVAGGTISLDYNERYTTTESYSHEF